MPRLLPSKFAVLAAAMALGACSSSRFDSGPSYRAVARPSQGYNAPLEPVAPAPSGAVTAAPLAPPPGAAGAPDGTFGSGVASGPVIADSPPPAPPPEPRPQQQASIAPPPVVPQSGRSSVVGGWNAKDASGTSCRVALSSSPALDLYKASSTGCGNRDLARVTAWDYRDGEVYLYQPGGTVTARLRPSGGSLEGVLSKSGAPLSMER